MRAQGVAAPARPDGPGACVAAGGVGHAPAPRYDATLLLRAAAPLPGPRHARPHRRRAARPGRARSPDVGRRRGRPCRAWAAAGPPETPDSASGRANVSKARAGETGPQRRLCARRARPPEPLPRPCPAAWERHRARRGKTRGARDMASSLGPPPALHARPGSADAPSSSSLAVARSGVSNAPPSRARDRWAARPAVDHRCVPAPPPPAAPPPVHAPGARRDTRAPSASRPSRFRTRLGRPPPLTPPLYPLLRSLVEVLQ